MRASVILGLILIVVGVIGFAYQGITYTSRDKVVDAGPIQISADREHTIPITPIASGVALAAGVAVILVGSRKA